MLGDSIVDDVELTLARLGPEPVSIRALAGSLEAGASTVSYALRSLEERGVVERVPCFECGRPRGWRLAAGGPNG